MAGTHLDPVRVIDSAIDCPALSIVVGGGSAKAVIWPGSGAEHRSMHLISLESGATTIVLSHPSDCVYYVIGGAGSIRDLSSDVASPLEEGAMVHIDAGDRYQLRSEGANFTLVGGACPADRQLYSHLLKE